LNLKITRNNVLTFLLTMGLFMLFFGYLSPQVEQVSKPYSDYLADVRTGQVTKVISQGQTLTVTDAGNATPYTVLVPGAGLQNPYADTLNAATAGGQDPAKIEFTALPASSDSAWLSLALGVLLPLLLMGGLLFFLIRRTQGINNQALSFGNSRARMSLGNKSGVTFADVAGVDEAKAELAEIVEFLKFPEKFTALGARIPRGVLLIGSPGSGKTLLARAISGEAGVPFFSISGSEFVELFVGVGAKRVRDLFEQAKKNAPCIVFLDEIDAVGRQRGSGLGNAHDEREQTLNQILVEMDGFDVTTNVILVAATNRPDVLDPALLRPGRFDRSVILDRPDVKGRAAILAVHAKGKPLDKSVSLEAVARHSPGFSGADLANLVNEAAILAARRGRKLIGMSEFQEALERAVAGPERKSRMISDAEKLIIAYHEGGHAVVQHVLPKCDPVSKVTIISRGLALGYTMAMPAEDRYLQSQSEFEDKIAGLLGGFVSEELVFGDTTTGAANDIARASEMARAMVTRFGMSANLGPRAFGRHEEMVFLGRDIGEQQNYSDELARQIDGEVRAIIERARLRARDVLLRYRDRLDALAARLVAVETIEAAEFVALLADHSPGIPSATSAASPSSGL
jgi:cell division protease FtsH